MDEINLINKEYSTFENMKIKEKESYISTREILEIIKLEKMQQMYIKKFISNFDYEYILNIETIRTHMTIIIRKLFLLENDSLKKIRSNIKNTRIVTKILDELKEDNKEKIFEKIEDMEENQMVVIKQIKENLKKLKYFNFIREDLDLINRLKIIAENENDFDDDYINETLSDFSKTLKDEYNILKIIIKNIFLEYKDTKKEEQIVDKD